MEIRTTFLRELFIISTNISGNVNDLKIVGYNDPKVVVDLDNNEFFHTNYDEMPWIVYDFGKR